MAQSPPALATLGGSNAVFHDLLSQTAFEYENCEALRKAQQQQKEEDHRVIQRLQDEMAAQEEIYVLEIRATKEASEANKVEATREAQERQKAEDELIIRRLQEELAATQARFEEAEAKCKDVEVREMALEAKLKTACEHRDEALAQLNKLELEWASWKLMISSKSKDQFEIDFFGLRIHFLW